MSAIRLEPTMARSEWVPAAGLLIALALLFIGGNLAGNGVALPAGAGGEGLRGWEQGSLLRVLLVWIAGWFGGVLDEPFALILLYVLIAALGGASIYRQLRASDWPRWQALLALGLVVAHPMLLQAVTLATPEFLLVLIATVLVPARRRLEAVGDVQSVVSFGLVLTFLLLAGPPLAALIPVLILAVPFSEREARRNAGVFFAMLLVAVVPVLIVIVGVWAMAARAGIDTGALVAPYIAAYAPGSGAVTQPLLLMALGAPAAFAALLHLCIPDRRRKVMTSLLVFAMPLWLWVGNAWLSFDLADWAPAAALLGAMLGWLGATRVRSWMRWLVLALLLVGTAAAWATAPLWADPAWLDGLLPIRFFHYRFG